MKFHPRIDLDDLNSGDFALVVCMLEAALARSGPPHPGDTLRPCPKCLRVMRVAPSSLALLADGERQGREVRIRCWECSREDMGRPGMEAGLAPGALEEILRRMGEDK